MFLSLRERERERSLHAGMSVGTFESTFTEEYTCVHGGVHDLQSLCVCVRARARTHTLYLRKSASVLLCEMKKKR